LRKVASSIKPVGSGRYRFANWKPKESIELTADTTNYRRAPKIRRLIWSYTPSAATAATRLLAGEVDVYDVLRPENVKDAVTHPNVQVMSSPGTDYVFLAFNLRDGKRQDRPNPIFVSRELRRALTMAVDIPSMVRNVFDTLAQPGIGPTIRAFPTTDTAIALLPHDPDRAAQILDSLGWKPKAPGGIRERNCRKLQFKILVPTSSINRLQMAVLLQAQLKNAGVDAILDEADAQERHMKQPSPMRRRSGFTSLASCLDCTSASTQPRSDPMPGGRRSPTGAYQHNSRSTEIAFDKNSVAREKKTAICNRKRRALD
jgi:peptide/nickel transport system substrate-binding protein